MTPIIGEIRLFAFQRPPLGWVPCNGQSMSKEAHEALFGVIGTLYGGDGTTSFALPNLQGRVAIGQGPELALGESGGEETHRLTRAEMPNHTHLLSAHSQPGTSSAHGHFPSAAPGAYSHSSEQPGSALAEHALAPSGEGQPHPNMQPYLALELCIATQGAAPGARDGDSVLSALLGEVRLFAGRGSPPGWAACDGQLLSIQEHTQLFAILGTTFGGDGTTTFAVPDLRGRVPLHEGQGPGLTPRALGESGGDARVMLTQSELPMHSHLAHCTRSAGEPSEPGGAGGIWADSSSGENAYAISSDDTLLSPRSVEYVGGNACHTNMQPYLGLSYIIALGGSLPEHPRAG